MNRPELKNQNQTERRSKLFVDQEVQSALVRRLLLHWFLFIFVTFGFVGLLQGCIEHPSESVSELISYVLSRNALGIVAGVALIPVFVWDTIRATNRFAGPITRLRGMLRSLAEGKEESAMSLRSGDYWKELANEFNAAIAGLRGQRARRQS